MWFILQKKKPCKVLSVPGPSRVSCSVPRGIEAIHELNFMLMMFLRNRGLLVTKKSLWGTEDFTGGCPAKATLTAEGWVTFVIALLTSTQKMQVLLEQPGPEGRRDVQPGAPGRRAL